MKRKVMDLPQKRKIEAGASAPALSGWQPVDKADKHD